MRSRIPGLILSSGEDHYGILHVVSVWVYSRFSGVLLSPTNMALGGLGSLNCHLVNMCMVVLMYRKVISLFTQFMGQLVNISDPDEDGQLLTMNE